MAEDPAELNCNFDTGDSTMEVTTVLLVGWTIFCILLVALGRYVNRRFLNPPVTIDGSVKTTPTTVPATTAAAAATPAAVPTAVASSAGAALTQPVTVATTTAAVAAAPPAVKVTKAKDPVKKKPRRELASVQSFAPTKPPSAEGGVTLRNVSAPAATGADKDAVGWVNDLLQWLYTDPAPTAHLHATWIKALNDIAKKMEAESGVQVVIQEVAPFSELPNMTNVMADPGPSKNTINILTDMESTVLAYVVQVTRQMGDNFWSTEYTCVVESLSGPLSVVCNTDSMTGIVHFDCRPKVNLSLKTNSRSEMDDPVDEHALQAVVSDIIGNALAHATVQVDVNKFPRCPRFIRKQVFAEPVIPVHYDSMIPVISPTSTPQKIQKRGKRLFVKVIKASNLGSDKGCNSPYCTVELDEPSQKHSTGINTGANPFWDEHFLLDLSNETGEILFEVWDKSPQEGKDRFLGLGIVSVDHLLRNPSQRQIVSLQSRPYEGDDITGSLTVEFLCMESVDVPKLDKEKPPRPPPPSKTVETVSKPQSSRDAPPQIVVNGEESTAPVRPERSTIIIHGVQREVALPTVKVEMTKNGTWHEATQPTETSAIPRGQFVAEVAAPIEDKGDSRSRPKERKSFMSTLKKRLSFRGKRSRSVDQHQESSSRDSSASRSVSADRSLAGSRGDNTSTRSSLSEMSGMSGSSAQTYVDEASMLVIEAVENGITKHYLIPSAVASKGKWKKRGTKLHIFNDHTFVAKHLPSNTVCQVCSKTFVRRIGKQGYECRDCQLKCHKPCHVRTDVHCPASTVASMELDYVQDLHTDLPDKKNK